MYMAWKDYDDFEKKYGSDVDLDNVSKRLTIWYSFNVLGNLLKTGLADKETIYGIMSTLAVWAWAKFDPIMGEHRRRYTGKDGFSGFEYLATEMLKMKKQKDPTWEPAKEFLKYIPDK